MKVKVDRARFAEEIKFVSQFLPRKAYAPRDAVVRLEVDAEMLRLSCDDGVSWATSSIPAVGEAGSVAVAGRLLTQIASTLPSSEKDVRLETAFGRLWIYCGAATFQLGLVDVFERPPFAALPHVGSVEALPFIGAVEQVSRSVSRDESRPVLCGVCLEVDSALTMVSTDSYRLTWLTLEWLPDVDNFATRVIVPATAVEEAAKFLTGRTEIDVCLAEDRNMVGFTDGRRRITTRLIDGQYVNWRRLFEYDSEPLRAVVDVHPLAEAVKRVSLVADKTSPVVLTFSDDVVTVEASGDGGEAREHVPAKFGSDEEFVIGFNPRYLVDGLASVPAAAAEIDLWESTKPAVMRGVDVDDFRYLLMPKRLEG